MRLYCLSFLSKKEHKPNIDVTIIGISSFQNGRNHPFSTTGFYFKKKIVEDNIIFSVAVQFYGIHDADGALSLIISFVRTTR